VHRAVVSSDLLNPFLARPIRDSGVATVRLLAHVGGIAARWWPSMSTLTDELCAPPRIPDLGEEFVDPEFDDDEPELWWEPYESTVKSIFDGIDEPTRLSQLLGRAEELAAAVSDLDGEPLDSGLLVAATVHAAHRAWATRLSGRSVGDRVVVAAVSGAEIDEYGVHAADLILVPGVVTADIDAPADEHIDNGEIDTGAAGVDISEEAIA
jgi:hypothetical protein